MIFFIDRETLPIFTAFRPYIVEVTTNNLGPELNNDTNRVNDMVSKNYETTLESSWTKTS